MVLKLGEVKNATIQNHKGQVPVRYFSNYPSHYISAEGDVYTASGTEATINQRASGVPFVRFRMKGGLVEENVDLADAVLTLWDSPCPYSYGFAQYVDGLCTDSSVENLIWMAGFRPKAENPSAVKKKQKAVVVRHGLTREPVYFSSAKEAAQWLKVSPSSVSRAISEKRECKGYSLSYET